MDRAASVIPRDWDAGAALEQLAARQSVVILAGLPGVGKSLLLQQLARMARAAGRQVSLLQWDVARRAFSPSLPINPGFVDYPVGLPRGSARNAFELISSLLPGSVPTDETEGLIEYHCLDVKQPVFEQLAVEERAHAVALLPGRRHG